MLVWAGPLDAVLQSENLNNSDTSVVSGKYIYLQSEGGGASHCYICVHAHILACIHTLFWCALAYDLNNLNHIGPLEVYTK